MDADEILAENARREAERRAAFDPVSGLGAPGTRRRVRVDGLGKGELWLPEGMMSAPLMRGLEEAGSVDEYIREEFGDGADGDGGSRIFCENAPLRASVVEAYVRLRCRHDFAFWCVMFVRVLSKEPGEGEVPFRLNGPQRRLVSEFERMREEGRPIRVILLKARQWGGSTATQLYMSWLQLMHRTGLNSVIVSQSKNTSFTIKGMLDRTLATYPQEMLCAMGEAPNPKEPVMVNVGLSGDYKRIPRRDCTITVASYENPDAIRGNNYALVHCSEVGLWSPGEKKSPDDVVRSACSGVMMRPYTMIVYESTANGTGNFFYDEWQAAVEGTSAFKPVFISWHDIDWNRVELTEAEERAAAERLLAMLDQGDAPSAREESGRYMWWLWERGASLQAIEWYRLVRSEKSSHAVMASEAPTDDVEAFVHSGAMVFDKYLVKEVEKGCREPRWVGEVQGRRTEGADALEDLRFAEDAQGGLKVWELPEEFSVVGCQLSDVGCQMNRTYRTYLTTENRQQTTDNGQRTTWADRYVTVVDIGGRGAKADWSVIVVFDRLDMLDGEGPRVVAQWRGHIDHDRLAWKAAQIAAFWGESLLVIESNTLETKDRMRDVDGDQSDFILAQIGDVYPNLYMRHAPGDAIAGGAPRKYGFHTNTKTKPMVISTLVKMVRDRGWTERDKTMVTELLQYEKKQNGAYGAIKGAHDDVLMTRAIGLHVAWYEMEPPRRREAHAFSLKMRPSVGSAAVF